MDNTDFTLGFNFAFGPTASQQGDFTISVVGYTAGQDPNLDLGVLPSTDSFDLTVETPPKILSATTSDSDSNGCLDTYTVLYDKNLQSTFDAADWTLTSSSDIITYTAVSRDASSSSGNTLVLKFDQVLSGATCDPDTGDVPSLSYTGSSTIKGTHGTAADPDPAIPTKDGAAPVILDAEVFVGTNKMEVEFSEPVQTTNGAPLMAGDFIFKDSSGSGIAIDTVSTFDHRLFRLTAVSDFEADGGTLEVPGTQDLAAPTPNPLAGDNPKTVKIFQLEMTGAKTADVGGNGNGLIDRIVLTFNKDLETTPVLDPSDWAVVEEASMATAVVSTVSRDTSNANVLFLDLHEVTTFHTGVEPTVTYTPQAGNEIRDATKEAVLVGDFITATDDVDPIIVEVRTIDSNVNGHLDGVQITFSEPLDGANLDAGHWIVQSGSHRYSAVDVDDTDLTDSVLVLTFAEQVNADGAKVPDTGATPTVTYNHGSDAPLADLNEGLALGSGTYAGTLDDAAPLLMSATGNPGEDFITLTFSEPVKGSGDDGELVLSNLFYTDNNKPGDDATGFAIPLKHNLTGGDRSSPAVVNITLNRPLLPIDLYKVGSTSGQADKVRLSSSDLITDLANIVAGSTADVPFADVTPPTVTSITTLDGDGDGYLDALRVTFSEPVGFGSGSVNTFAWEVYGRDVVDVLYDGDYTHPDAADVGVTYPTPEMEDRTLYVAFTEGSNHDTGERHQLKYTGSGKGAIDDLLGNGLDTPPQDLWDDTHSNYLDGAAPLLLQALTYDAGVQGNGYLDGYYLFFTEDVERAVDDSSGYPLTGGWNVTGRNGESAAATSDKMLLLAFDPSETPDTGEKPGFTFDGEGNVTDVAGNPVLALDTADGGVTLVDGAAPILAYVEGNPGDTEILAVFSEPVSMQGTDITEDAFVYVAGYDTNGDEIEDADRIVSVQHTAWDSNATIILKTRLTQADLDAGHAIRPVGSTVNDTVDLNRTGPLSLTAPERLAPFSDVTPPKVEAVFTGDEDVDGFIDRIFIAFNEKLDPTHFEVEDFVVLGFAIDDTHPDTGLSSSGMDVVLVLKEHGKPDTDDTPHVFYNADSDDGSDPDSLTDMVFLPWDGNLSSSGPSAVAQDKAPPVLLSASFTEGSPFLDARFSEPVFGEDDGTGGVLLDAFGFTDGTATGAVQTLDDIEHGAGSPVVRFNASADFVTGDDSDRLEVLSDVFDAEGLAAVNLPGTSSGVGLGLHASLQPTLIKTVDADQDGVLDAIELTFEGPEHPVSADAAGALNATAWSVDGHTVRQVSIQEGKVVVELEPSEADTAKTPAVNYTRPFEGAVTDAEGAYTASFDGETLCDDGAGICTSDGAGPVLLRAFASPGLDEVKLIFSEPLDAVPETGIDYYNAPGTAVQEITDIVDGESTTDSTYVAKLNATLAPEDLSADSILVKVGMSDAAAIPNQGPVSNVTILDDVAPRIVETEVVTVDGDQDGWIDALRVTLSEPYASLPTSLPDGAFEISDGYGDGMQVLAGEDDLSFYLTFTELPDIDATATGGDTSATPTLNHTGGSGITDRSGNDLATASDIVAKDGVGPVALSAVSVDEDFSLSDGVDQDDGDGYLDAYLVEFSENITVTSTSVFGWRLGGVVDATSAYLADADGKTTTSTYSHRLMVTFDGKDLEETHKIAAGTGDAPQLTYKGGNVKDTLTNPLVEVTDGSLAEVDEAAPAIRYATAQPYSKKVLVVFSEGVYNGVGGGLSPARFVYSDPGVTITSVSHRAFDSVATLTLDTTIQPSDLDNPEVTTDSPKTVAAKPNKIFDRFDAPVNTLPRPLVDRTGPSVFSATTDDGDHDGRIDEILIVFDEVVNFSGFEEDDFEVLGYTITGSETVSTTGLRLTLKEEETRDYDTGETPTIVYDGSKGLNNQSALTDTTMEKTPWSGLFPTTTDGADPVLISAQTVNDTTVRVRFSEPVLAKNETDADVPLKPEHFVYDGGTATNTVSIVRHRLGDHFADLVLETPLQKEDWTEDDPDSQDYVSPAAGILDGNGNESVVVGGIATSVPVVGGPMLHSVTARGSNSVDYLEVVFSRNVNDTTVAASISGGWHSTLGAITGIHPHASDAANDDTVYLAFSPATGYEDDTGIRPKVSYNGTVLKDTDGGPLLPFAAYEAIDAVAPRILTIETVDDAEDGTLDSLNVTFSEAMDLSGFDGADWTVEGQTGALAITESSPSRTITLPLATAVDTAAKPHVSYAVDAGFNDTAGNALPAQTDFPSIDKAAPVLLSATSAGVGEREVTLVFSEPVKAASLTKDNLTYVNEASGGASGIESINAYGGGDEVVVVLNADFATADHNADTIAATADLLDAADNAASTAPVAIVTDVVDPAAVGDVTLTDVKANSVTLEFDSVGDDGSDGEASFYVVGYHEGSSTDWATATKVNFTADAGDQQSHRVEGLKNSTAYTFAVRAKDDAGNLGGASAWKSTTTADDGTPPAGTLAITSTTHTADQASSKTAATLAWNELVDGESVVAYHYKLSDSATYKVLKTDPADSDRSVTLTSLDDGVHYFHVAAISAGGEKTAQFKLVIDTVAPAKVADFETGTATPLGITLSWKAPGDDGATGTAKEYQIYRSESAFTAADLDNLTLVSGVVAPAAAGTAQTFEVTGLTPDTDYHFAIRARDDAGNAGPLSAVVKKSTLPDTTPPTGDLDLRSTSHVQGAKSNLRDLSFRWDAATDAETDVFYRYALVEDADEGLSSSDETTTETRVELEDVESGTWTFLVAAESAGGRGATEAFQVILLGISDEDLHEANEGVVVKVTRKGDTNVVTWKLSKDTPADVEGVQVLRSNSPYRVVATLPADSEEFKDGTFVDDSDGAKAGSKYLVTLYYGESASLGKQPEGEDLVLSESLMDGAVVPVPEGGVFGHAAFYIGLVAVLAIVGFAVAAVVMHARQRPAIARGRERDQDHGWEASA